MNNRDNINHLKEVCPHNNLPFLFPSGFSFECLMCGGCCRHNWRVMVSPEFYLKLKQKLNQDGCHIAGGEEESVAVFSPEDGKFVLLRKEDKRCIMMRDGNLCSLQAQWGVEYKPPVCRKFPLSLTPSPDGIYVGVSFVCPSALSDNGKPLENLGDIIEISTIEELYSTTVGKENRVEIYNGIHTCWKGYKFIEEFITDSLYNGIDIHSTLWDLVNLFKGLVSHFREEHKVFISEDDIKEYIELFFNPPSSPAKDLPAGSDPLLGDLLFTSLSIVSALESQDVSLVQENLDKLLRGGEFFCKTFNKTLNFLPFGEIPTLSPSEKKRAVFLRYIHHLIWKKCLIKDQPLLQGLMGLNLLYPCMEWYLYASILNRRSPGSSVFSYFFPTDEDSGFSDFRPSDEDFFTALSSVESPFWHSDPNVILPFSSFLTQQL